MLNYILFLVSLVLRVCNQKDLWAQKKWSTKNQTKKIWNIQQESLAHNWNKKKWLLVLHFVAIYKFFNTQKTTTPTVKRIQKETKTHRLSAVILAFILHWFRWNRCFVSAFFDFSFFVLFEPVLPFDLLCCETNTHKNNSSKQ